jgi:uncharacterized repeat protein (TIGR01451 family)
MPRIDPTGEHVFAQELPMAARADYHDLPGGQLRCDDVAVTLSPRSIVYPVGAEAVMVAGVRGPDKYLMTNRRLEWSLAAGSVGSFVDIGKNDFCDVLRGDFNSPKIVNSTYAIGSTSREALRLTKGTCSTADDVYVLDGQGWITVTSPVEGTSYVTVYAPEVYPWDARTQSAAIHWVDAQCRFPPPSINPAGTKHTFTTTVMRQSNQCPCVGWRVRYQISCGPEAGFSPSGAATAEVLTDQAGQASVEIFQKQPAAGTNNICIQVMRPPDARGEQLVVFNGTTMKTWTSPALAVCKTGPAACGVGSTLTYRTEVSNPGDQPAQDVVVSEEVPANVSFISSNPPAEVMGRRLQWRLGVLGPYERRAIEVSYRADRPGSVTSCVDVSASNGLKATHCATTTIAAGAVPSTGAALTVNTTGPTQVNVGGQVTFEILIANRGQAPLSNLVVRDEFDPGLEHKVARSPIENPLGVTLEPGQIFPIQVTFRAARAGRLCHRVEVTAAGGMKANAEGCVMAVGTGPAPGGEPSAQPKRLSVLVKKLGSEEQNVGETAQFTIELSNNSNRALTNVTVVAGYDSNLRPEKATAGNKPESSSLVWVIDSLPAGRPVALEVQALCLSAVAKSCLRVTASTPEGDRAAAETCFTIREAPSGIGAEQPSGGALVMTVADFRDPIKLGETERYEIRVMNQGRNVDRDVTLVVTVPDGMTPEPLGTTGPPGTSPKINNLTQTVTFSPADEIQPGETLTYYIRARTQRPGQARLRVELTSMNQRVPKVAEETTDVIQ